MRYVFGLIVFAATLFLTACGPGQNLSKYIVNSNQITDLTGGTDSEGRNYTGFSSLIDQEEVKKQIPQTDDNKQFAQNFESVKAFIDKLDLKVEVKWTGLNLPLVFQGRLQPGKSNEFYGRLDETSGQKTDLSLKVSCQDSECQVINAILEDKQNHKVGIIIRQEVRELDLQIPEETLNVLPKEKRQALETFKNNNKATVTSTEVFPGKTTYQISQPEGSISGELVETNDGAVEAKALGKLSELGNIELVGNTNTGELVFSVGNEVEVPQKPVDQSWLGKILNPKKPEPPKKETVNAFIFIKPRPQVEKKPEKIPEVVNPNSKPDQTIKTEKPKDTQVVDSSQKPSAKPEPKPEIKLPTINPAGMHELVKQVVKDANRPEVQEALNKIWLQNKSDKVSYSDFQTSGKIYRFLFLHEKMPFAPNRQEANLIKKMTSILQDNKLPVAMTMLSYVESGFTSKAKSSAGALGWWQFMPGTAADYGLQTNESNLSFDKRISLDASTRAASRFLNDLLKTWNGDLKMALASYNAGAGRMSEPADPAKGEGKKLVNKLKRDGVSSSDFVSYKKDFWVLSYYNTIPKQTKEFVPKIFSGIIISLDPQAYGIDAKPLETY